VSADRTARSRLAEHSFRQSFGADRRSDCPDLPGEPHLGSARPRTFCGTSGADRGRSESGHDLRPCWTPRSTAPG